jgi:3'(2'), 5'-bisphosphate nucleotidase
MLKDLAALAEPVSVVARKASRRILEIYATDFTVTEKSDRSPVTEADLVAHETIAEGLAAIEPGIPLVSEEAPGADFEVRRHWDWFWLVDPLDGTREFVRRSGQFSVNIALINRCTAVFGLILIPTSGVCYFGYRDGGAFKQLPGRPPQAIHTRRIGAFRLRVTGSRVYVGRRLQGYLKYLGKHDYLGVGSALKPCLVAEGKADIYPRFGPTSEWDTAAAQIIVEQAGGGLTDFRMRPLRYNTRPGFLNPDFIAFGDCHHDWTQYLPRDEP